MFFLPSLVALATLASSKGTPVGNRPATEQQVLVEQKNAHARSLSDLHSSPALSVLLSMPPSPVAPPASPSMQPILVPLVGALIQCVSLILIGYWCKRSGLFSADDASGLSAFVGRLSLPALLFLSMATLDIEMIDTLLLCTILIVKGIVFLLVVISCRVTDGLEVRLSLTLTPTLILTPTPILILTPTLTLTTNLLPNQVVPDETAAARPAPPGAPTAGAEPPCRVSFAEPPPPPPGKQSWLSRAGLYAIFATQSNDFALGLPLIQAIWGSEVTIMVYLVAPFQLGILNPLAFALMEWGAADAADADADAAAAAVTSSTSSINSATASLLPAHACAAAAAAAAAAPRRASRARRVRRVLRKVLRSPLVTSVLVGLAVRLVLWLSGPEAALPSVVKGIFQPLQDAFTATALVTLGLSLDPKLGLLVHQPTSSACLLFGKVPFTPLLDYPDPNPGPQPTDPNLDPNPDPNQVLFTPLAMLIVGDLLGIESERSRAFSFIYGMLPSAPTVIVFAREYGQPSETLAALQFLCLLLAVPFLFVSTAALQLPMVVGDEATRPISNHDRNLDRDRERNRDHNPAPAPAPNPNSNPTRALTLTFALTRPPA